MGLFLQNQIDRLYKIQITSHLLSTDGAIIMWVFVTVIMTIHLWNPILGVSDSDSDEFSSLERENKKEDIYARVNRRPTPHKKKSKPRHADMVVLPPPPLPPYTEDRHVLIHQDQLDKGKEKGKWQTYHILRKNLNLSPDHLQLPVVGLIYAFPLNC